MNIEDFNKLNIGDCFHSFSISNENPTYHYYKVLTHHEGNLVVIRINKDNGKILAYEKFSPSRFYRFERYHEVNTNPLRTVDDFKQLLIGEHFHFYDTLEEMNKYGEHPSVYYYKLIGFDGNKIITIKYYKPDPNLNEMSIFEPYWGHKYFLYDVEGKCDR